jgi:hypothetical protein
MNIEYRIVGKWDEYEKLENIAFMEIKTDIGNFNVSLERDNSLRISVGFDSVLVKPVASNVVHITRKKD